LLLYTDLNVFMSTNISLGFLIITGALLSTQATNAQNSLPTAPTPVANNTLKTQASVVNSFTIPDPVDVPVLSAVTKIHTTQTQIFSSDVATISPYRNQISAIPAQVDSAASVAIPVPSPRTQLIPRQQSIPSPQSKINTVTGIEIPVAAPATIRNSIQGLKPSNSIDRTAPSSSSVFIYPLTTPATISSRFGWRTHPLTGSRRFHSGVDIAAPTGAPVVATASGTVVSAGWNGGYGNAVIIQHNDTQQTLYGHLSKVSVKLGEMIAQGTIIGLVGSTGNSTGPHLHFESRTPTVGVWTAVDPSQEIQYAVDSLRRSMPYAQKDLPPGI
jgi:murein DD-endopeptidase MepM/ murein hydrolase activator NlpD